MVFGDVRLFTGVLGEVVELMDGDVVEHEFFLNGRIESFPFAMLGELPFSRAEAERASVAIVLRDDVAAAFGAFFSKK